MIKPQDVFYEFERKAKHKGHNPGEFVLMSLYLIQPILLSLQNEE